MKKSKSNTGTKGITWHVGTNKYQVRLGHNQKYMGSYDTLVEAQAVLLMATKRAAKRELEERAARAKQVETELTDANSKSGTEE